MKLEREGIYETDAEGGHVAAYVVRADGEISWNDLTHRRAYAIQKVIRETPTLLEWEDKQGRRHVLRLIDAAGARDLARRLQWDGPTPTPGQLKVRVRKALNQAH